MRLLVEAIETEHKNLLVKFNKVYFYLNPETKKVFRFVDRKEWIWARKEWDNKKVIIRPIKVKSHRVAKLVAKLYNKREANILCLKNKIKVLESQDQKIIDLETKNILMSVKVINPITNQPYIIYKGQECERKVVLDYQYIFSSIITDIVKTYNSEVEVIHLKRFDIFKFELGNSKKEMYMAEDINFDNAQEQIQKIINTFEEWYYSLKEETKEFNIYKNSNL